MTDKLAAATPVAQAQRMGGLPLPVTGLAEALPVPTTTSTTAVESAPQPPLPVGTPNPLEARSAFSSDVHQYIREYIQLADQKAMFFFAVATALLAFLYKGSLSARWVKPILTWNVLDVVAFVAMGGLAVASFLALLTVIPRTPGSRRGYLFWEAVAEFRSGREYADDLATLSPGSLVQTRAEHCFELANVCKTKYSMLRRALLAGSIGLFATLVVLLFVLP